MATAMSTSMPGGGQARYEILPDEARVVRQVFDWVGRDRLTIGEVCRRLTQAGERTRTGQDGVGSECRVGHLEESGLSGQRGVWQDAPRAPASAAARPAWPPVQPRRAVSTMMCPPEDWIPIPVPALVEPEVFAAVQEQLQENRVMPGNRAGARCICCKAWCNVSSVAMPSTANASARVPARASPVPTRITAAWARMPIALAANGSVRIRRYGRISWTWRSGRKSVRCWPTRTAGGGISASLAAGDARHTHTPGHRRRRRSASCARAWPG